MIYQGIIPFRQQEVDFALPHWQYGVIKDGRKIIDPHLHFGCFTMGYKNPEILEHVMKVMQDNRPEVAESFINHDKLYLNHVSFEFADRLHKITSGYRPIFSLSGSDANEGAIKLAAAYHQHHGRSHKKTLVGFEKSYHGSTWMTMGLGQSLWIDPFYTLDRYPNIKHLPRDFEIDGVDWNPVACIILETSSWCAGFEPADDDFWQKIRFVQQEYDVMIIIDDIFICGGKTGHYLGWKHLPVTPDIFTIGKAMTAGFFPLSATLCAGHVYDAMKELTWEHGFTYNFNLSGIASAMKYLDILERDQLLQQHDDLVAHAQGVFASQDTEIVNRFGLNFIVRPPARSDRFYLIPVNATQEYFDMLAENLEYERHR
jgi:adenosylmethionine-8-amino-7-oxononanoate aminotransferase